MQCVIPCAGESSRMSHVPKHLIKIGDKPLLTRVIDTWEDSVDSFIFVIKRSMTHVWELLPENSIIVFQDKPMGLADAILRAEKCITGKFVVALGDCLHKGKFKYDEEPELGVGVWRTMDLAELNKSYLVEVGLDGFVQRVAEKPRLAKANRLMYCGMGTYFFDPRVFGYIRRYNGMPGGGDLTYVIQTMINAGEWIVPVRFKGKYVNVTGPEDIGKAEEIFKQ